MSLDAALNAAALALSAGAVVIVLFAVPFVVVSYRRRGGLTFWRTAGWIGTVVYAFAIWTYTIPPLPGPDDAWCVGAILDPLNSVRGALHYAAAGTPLLRNPVLQEMALNVVFFVPLGFLLRAILRRGVAAAAIVGFGVSLLVETTQLTGVWGLLHCAHRFFDVTDLATNTTGAVLGSLLARAFVRPGADRAGADAHLPRAVTAGRRLTAGLVDLLAAGLLAGAVRLLATPGDAPAVAVAGTLLAFAVHARFVLATGATLGERAVLLRAQPGRFPAVAARPLRLLVGIGGCILLSGAGLDLAATLLALANAAALLFTPSRRSLAQLSSDLRLADARVTVAARSEVSPAAAAPRERRAQRP
ncbi:VanZ family protein [Leifsonia shinshuensis]|uniref:VanZ family protein n=1 Tax=Leifsonia shinshuensis TaxID=150026 RepID=UPI001F505A6F|nr:VanZ family protein [Leifsonia shinshuensis]MCI0156979.1 VanZ family protein [Leifsonia shinshuensis]